MRTFTITLLLPTLLLLVLLVTLPCAAQKSLAYNKGTGDNFVPTQRDSASNARLSNVDDVAKRVDSLQFIVVYNYDLLRRDLDSKVVWIYVMLGVMIVASMMMYGALNQATRQRKELEERVFNSLSSSVANLEAQIKSVEAEIPSKAQRPPPAARKKKRA